MDTILSIFWGIVLLGLIVFVHEGGHFLAARMFGVRVTEFMLGLPGPNIGFKSKKSHTKFGVTCIPLGGYARIAGMDEWRDESHLPEAVELLYSKGEIKSEDLEALDEMQGYDVDDSLDILKEWGTAIKIKTGGGAYKYAAPEIAGFELGEPRGIRDAKGFIAAERSQTYISLPWWKRMIILFGGAGFNLIFAIIALMFLLTLSGVTQATLTVSEVTEGLPAYEAGMRAGDTLTQINGVDLESWSDFTSKISELSVGDSVEVTYEHEGESHEVTMQTVANDSGSAIIGVTSKANKTKLSFVGAAKYSAKYIALVTTSILKLLNPQTAGEVISQSSSIIGISVAAKEAASSGFINFIWLAAALSISIGLMNLLPFMPLDGGRMVVETIQRVSRRLLSVRAINIYTMLGMAFILLIFVLAMKQDISSLITGAWPW